MHEILLAVIALMDLVILEAHVVKSTFYIMVLLDCRLVPTDTMLILILKLAKLDIIVDLHDMDEIGIIDIPECPKRFFIKEQHE